MKPHFTLVLCAALAILAATGGCSTFRRIFAGDNIIEANRIVDAEEKERKEKSEQRKHRDPVSDMFDTKRMRDRTPRHQGIGLTPEERAIFDAAEDSAERDRALIDAEKRRMGSDRKERRDWVFSFKPDK